MAQNASLTEKDVALDLMTSSKSTIATLAKVVAETTNPLLRKTLKDELTTCINSHHRLSDIAISKGWYNAYENPQQQLQSELSGINTITQ